MTVNEAAAKLDTSASNVRDALKRGALKGEKHGRDWWLDPAEVARYGKENRYATRRAAS